MRLHFAIISSTTRLILNVIVSMNITLVYCGVGTHIYISVDCTMIKYAISWSQKHVLQVITWQYSHLQVPTLTTCTPNCLEVERIQGARYLQVQRIQSPRYPQVRRIQGARYPQVGTSKSERMGRCLGQNNPPGPLCTVHCAVGKFPMNNDNCISADHNNREFRRVLRAPLYSYSCGDDQFSGHDHP